MTQAGSSDDLHVLAPVSASDSVRSRRTGYLALAASGLITATAFAGIADLASNTIPSASPGSSRVQEFERGTIAPPAGSNMIPGEAYPEHGEISISGAAVAETFRPKDPTDPTVVVVTHPDGTTTTTVLPPPPPRTTTTHGTTTPDDGGTSTTPDDGGTTTTTPDDGTTTTTTPDDGGTSEEPSESPSESSTSTSETSSETSSTTTTSDGTSSGGDNSTQP
ncbi:MAG: hypothetical protein ACRDQ7_25570 [Haloechinothrix sp.]